VVIFVLLLAGISQVSKAGRANVARRKKDGLEYNAILTVRSAAREREEIDKIEERTENAMQEIETDIAAITLSYLITQGVRCCLTNQYPVHHLLMQIKNDFELQSTYKYNPLQLSSLEGSLLVDSNA